MESKIKYPAVCYFIGIVLIVYAVGSIASLIVLHLDLVHCSMLSPNLKSLFMCGGFGVLGASVSAIRKYYRTLITSSTGQYEKYGISQMNWELGWTYYYLSRPLLGGILGAFSYILGYTSVIVLTNPTAVITDSGEYSLYSISFISGFAVSYVLDKIELLSKQLFQKEN